MGLPLKRDRWSLRHRVTAAGAMVIVLLFLTRPLETVPTAALAAVVIGAVLRLIEVRSLRALWRIRRSEFLIALTTAFGAVVLGLLEGIVIGVALTLVDFGVRRSGVAGTRRAFETRGRPALSHQPSDHRRRRSTGSREPCTSRTRCGSGTARFGSSKAHREFAA